MTESILIRVYDDDDGPIHPEIMLSDFIANPSAYRVELVDDEITKLVDRVGELETEAAGYREEACGRVEVIRRQDEEIEYLRDNTVPKVNLKDSDATRAEITVLRHQHEKDGAWIAELEKALRPFAESAAVAASLVPGGTPPSARYGIEFRYLEAARALLPVTGKEAEHGRE